MTKKYQKEGEEGVTSAVDKLQQEVNWEDYRDVSFSFFKKLPS